MAKKPVTSKEFTDAVCAMLKRLHPAMDVEAVVEELLRGHTSPRDWESRGLTAWRASWPICCPSAPPSWFI